MNPNPPSISPPPHKPSPPPKPIHQPRLLLLIPDAGPSSLLQAQAMTRLQRLGRRRAEAATMRAPTQWHLRADRRNRGLHGAVLPPPPPLLLVSTYCATPVLGPALPLFSDFNQVSFLIVLLIHPSTHPIYALLEVTCYAMFMTVAVRYMCRFFCCISVCSNYAFLYLLNLFYNVCSTM
jgi:hypothetical protein